MKNKILIFTFLLAFISALNAQQTEKGKVGFTYSFGGGTNANEYFQSIDQNSKLASVTNVGFIYLHPANANLELETGINYTLFKMSANPELLPAETASTSALSMINIPLGVRASAGKYFFVNGGVLLDFELNNSGPYSKQSGLGAYGGLGAKAEHSSDWGVFLGPEIRLHSLIPFNSWKNHQRTFDWGVKFGVTHRL